MGVRGSAAPLWKLIARFGGQPFENGAVVFGGGAAAFDQIGEGGAHGLELSDFLVDGVEVLLGERADAGLVLVAGGVESEQTPAFLDVEAEVAGLVDEAKLVDIGGGVVAIAVVAARR